MSLRTIEWYLGITLGCLLSSSVALGNGSDELKSFVCKVYSNGAVPFEEAQQKGVGERGAANIHLLTEILNSPSDARCWYNSAMTLGAIGTQESVNALTEFFLSGSGKLTRDQFTGKSGAILALGWAANTSSRSADGSASALAFLISMIAWSPDNPVKKISWEAPLEKFELRKYLTGRVVQALALTGTEKARQAIQSSVICKKDVSADDCSDALQLLKSSRSGLATLYR